MFHGTIMSSAQSQNSDQRCSFEFENLYTVECALLVLNGIPLNSINALLALSQQCSLSGVGKLRFINLSLDNSCKNLLIMP